jgi:hypothetical protein
MQMVKVWDEQGDVGDIISIGKLIREEDGPKEIEQIIRTLSKYGDDVSGRPLREKK